MSAAGLAAGGLGGFSDAVSAVGGGNPARRTAWRVPQAAWLRDWGLAGPGPCTSFGDPECRTGVPTVIPGAGPLREAAGGLSMPGLGIPLGGVGAGSFQYNLFGSFGPWNMGGSQSSIWELRTVPQAAFHVREEVDGVATVKTLVTPHDNIAPSRRFPGGLPAWNLLSPGDGTYAALYPFGWTTYDVFQSNVSMRFWSPIVAGEDERTSMPVAFFDVALANPTDKAIDVSVMFTFPNATSHPTGTTRTGLYSRFDTDAESGVSGVTLGSDDPTNTPDAVQSEWTLAALPASDRHRRAQNLTYVTSWNGDGDGSDIYDAFSSTGELPNGALDTSNSAGAVAVSAHLPRGRGHTTTIRFALSWDFPQVYYGSPAGNGRRAIWMRRYTEFLGARSTETNDYVAGSYPFRQAFTIAKRELARHDDSLASVEAWWKPIAENRRYPAWLRTAALNELYHLVFNASFWEAGLVNPFVSDESTPNSIVPSAGGPRLGSEIPDTHLFFFIDGGNGGATANEMDMDSAGYLAPARLFPNIEIGRIRAWLQLVKQNPIGRVPQQIFPSTGPYISATAAIQSEPANAPDVFGAPPPGSNDLGELFAPTGGSSFRDCAHKLIHRTYALYKETNDDSLVAYAYPTMLRALRRMYFFRPPGSHLPMDPPSNNPPNTMDQIPVDGHGIYNCMLHLLSLQILSTLTPEAIELGVAEATPEVQAEMDTELAAGKAEFEEIFWNPTTGRYRFCDGTGGIGGRTGRIRNNPKIVPPPDAVFVDAFYAHAVGSQLGLPPVIDLERARTHWNNVADALLAPTDADGNPTGPPTMLDENLNHYPIFPVEGLGSLPETSEVIPGCAWMGVAAAVHIGRQTGDRNLVAKALQMGEAVADHIYDDGSTTKGYAFATPESWFVDEVNQPRFTGYTRPRSIWQIIDALDPGAGRPRRPRPGQG